MIVFILTKPILVDVFDWLFNSNSDNYLPFHLMSLKKRYDIAPYIPV